ncbi:MAG: GAF domain-containing protein, partial [Anaerolineales bacterium]|nr:GAF domain-containing protein [Anaerolineales bacterium]
MAKKTAKKISGQPLSSSDQVIEQVRQLAWTGQHAAAIDSATQALSAPKIKPTHQMDLLDLRSESYIAIGKLDLAMKDAKAMGKIGRTSKVKGLKVQALNRLALVQMRTGDLKAALKSSNMAVKTKHNSAALRAESLFRLSEAQYLTRQKEATLENACLFDETQRLLKETEQRNAELAIINSVQAGLAAKMDIQGIYNLVGDKLRDIFDAQVADIGLYDRKDNLLHFPYIIERGVRFPSKPLEVIGYRKYVIENRQYLLINENIAEAAAKYGNPTAIQGEMPKSLLYVPMVVGDEVKGVISLQNLDREHAFSESDVRLLETLANSMSVALENARLFDETQRLLKITEERNAELAIINSVQAALAAELDMQGIYDAVGNKIRDIFDAQIVVIGILDHESRQANFNYFYELGERYHPDPVPFSGMIEYISKTGEMVAINENMLQESERYNMHTPAGGEPKSGVWMPIKSGGHVQGIVSLQNLEREHAFSDSEIRLLQTLANAMSV